MRTWILLSLCVVGVVSADSSQSQQKELHDAREGDDVTLKCRFPPDQMQQAGEDLAYYWVRTTTNGHDNVAFGNLAFDKYKLHYAPDEGRYDLTITSVSYERDNGRFECRVRAPGSGKTFYSQSHTLVVLTVPQPPVLTPSSHAQAQEGRELQLSCSSTGGSPEPIIKWYRDGSMFPSEANVTRGRTRAEATVSTLTISPTKEDDGATFRCSVWNRAMPEGEQLNANVELNVYYYPRVEVGPENPLRVEVESTATMDCKVDAKPAVTSVRWTRNGKFVSNSFTYSIPGASVQDAGKYTCSAENGLGVPGERDIFLDVLYPPSVTVDSKTYEAEEGGSVEIKCDVSANPPPTSVEWTMEGKPEFLQKGSTLQLPKVSADTAGTYVCRAANVLSTSDGKRAERAGSASVAVLVRHRPGRAAIAPARPVVPEGAAVTLACSASPPGWPAPQFRWFRDIDPADAKPAALATGAQYTIPAAHLGSEGVYHCQATNELGHGAMASAALQVLQPPRFQAKLPTHATQRASQRDYAVSCSALGKPRPALLWHKDNAEIKPDTNLFEVKTEVVEGRSGVYTVQSTLRFRGNARPRGDDLLPDDRGLYSCTFENEVKKVESTMHLRIEHEPIAIKQQSKVAFDVSEVGVISCRVQAFPKPEFQWYFGSNSAPLQMSSDAHYEINTTTDSNDSYLSLLKIRSVTSQDYGDYFCKVKNSLGSIKPQIRLQPKGAPESPTALASQMVGPSFVSLKWEPGFDGGLSNTKYFVRYRRIASRNSASGSEHCSVDKKSEFEWMEYDCGRANPCNVTRLNQHNSYSFKVKAVNTKGQSNYSNEITVATKVDRIQPPEQVTFDPSTRTVVFSVGPTCLPLVGVAEGLTHAGGWQVVDTIPLQLSGSAATVQEAVLERPNKPRGAREPALDELNPRMKVKLCLQVNQEVCSEYTEAELGPSYIKEASTLTTATLIAIIVSCLVFLLFLSLLFVFCRCKRSSKAAKTDKDYEMDAMHPAMTPQNQAPPPYYPSTGMENKALEHSMDLALDDSKNAVYGTQGGYGYHIAPHAQPHPPQNMAASDWNMGYMEGYANSNNGGSVNSQDSLWQMKMAGGGGPHGYGYDAHGYGAVDDYAPYPHLAPPMRAQQTPSRQEYCSDPYASVHKPKKRMDQHIESPYHEVSGLPQFESAGEEKPPHLSLSYDESLESGYSTPNSRARRVIREIIV